MYFNPQKANRTHQKLMKAYEKRTGLYPDMRVSDIVNLLTLPELAPLMIELIEARNPDMNSEK